MENWIHRICEPKQLYLAWQASDHMQDRFRWAVAILHISQDLCTLRYLSSGVEFESLNQGRSLHLAEALGYQGYPAFNPRRSEHNSGVLEALMRRLPPPQWYAADSGLATVQALVAVLQDDPLQLGTEGPQVLGELEEYARVLERTVKAGLRWHLAVSWR